jgi:hypothetical protein
MKTEQPAGLQIRCAAEHRNATISTIGNGSIASMLEGFAYRSEKQHPAPKQTAARWYTTILTH